MNEAQILCVPKGSNLIKSEAISKWKPSKDRCEVRLKHMKSLYSDVEGVTNFEHLLNGMSLDAVVVAAPASIIFPWPSLLAGKNTMTT
jgi:hypothetical protein